MALDYGEKYIGIAVNEPVFMTVHGRDTLLRGSLSEDLAFLLTLADREEIDLLVVGLPLSETGEETPTSAKVRAFVKKLVKKRRYSSHSYREFEVVFWDERFTTQDAEMILEEREIPKRDRKRHVDRISAILLLEDYISSHDLSSSHVLS